jgi:hypothetical protein
VDNHPVNSVTPATFSDVFELLERANVRYVVTSGVAVVLHGYDRPLADLDIVISAQPGEPERAQHALMLAGFVPSIPVPLAMLRVLRMFDQSQREVDVFVRYQIPFDELWADSEMMNVAAGSARVLSLEHLLRAKRMVGRPHDLEDVAALMSLKSDAG